MSNRRKGGKRYPSFFFPPSTFFPSLFLSIFSLLFFSFFFLPGFEKFHEWYLHNSSRFETLFFFSLPFSSSCPPPLFFPPFPFLLFFQATVISCNQSGGRGFWPFYLSFKSFFFFSFPPFFFRRAKKKDEVGELARLPSLFPPPLFFL